MKLIQTKEYLLLIDEEAEIKPDDYINHDTVEGVVEANDEWDYRGEKDDYWNKIIAYYPLTKEAKKLDLPLLPPFEESTSIRELALSLYNEPVNKRGEKRTQLVGHGGTPFGFNKWFKSFKVVYKAAQSKQFSLEDLISNFKPAFDKFINDGGAIGSSEECIQWQNVVEWFPKFLQSLFTQQLPKGFIISDEFSTLEENIKNGKYKW